MACSGMRHRLIAETPWAIVDLETTGLRPQHDQIVEIAIVRLEPDGKSSLVLDTLINPGRSVTASEIHGITDHDVANAPRFREVAAHVAASLSGCIVAAYNAYFDLPFVQAELAQAGFHANIPHLCLMWMRPMLAIGNRCRLADACAAHAIALDEAHCAASDARAAAGLLKIYLNECQRTNKRTFGDLASENSYRFLNSLDADPINAIRPVADIRFVSRSSRTFARRTRSKGAIAQYWAAMCVILSDLVVDEEEIGQLDLLRDQLQLEDEQIRSLHAKIFRDVLDQFVENRRLNAGDVTKLQMLWNCLAKLGWAPGQPLPS